MIIISQLPYFYLEAFEHTFVSWILKKKKSFAEYAVLFNSSIQKVLSRTFIKKLTSLNVEKEMVNK